ncbi:COX15/CtaA family protein [Dokdonella sp.]|uniref:COX15/CtaA family protein n=1 Tax=Dokdonella sp. TaxID=2291710 RepID=UPI0025C2C65E|nr:COX15/CtaA family protein [Dokdonella sp.]MBX3691709.1 COX15/CtaA family protein [Dokdonella sp.]
MLVERGVEADARAVGVWLLACCVTLFALVMLGGATRLTESGLSIVDWRPVTGVLPPIGEAAWLAEFDRYRDSPQYQQVNRGMSLDEFRTIFWFEYGHRLLARALGLLFALPLAWFWWRRRIPAGTHGPLLGILLLGAAQGYMGWYMVKSGLVDMPRVSAYRLAAHLGLALLIFAAMLRLALRLLRPRRTAADHDSALRRFSRLLLAMVALTILYGAFVAGQRAGYAYNTFPLMAGRWIPEGLLVQEPLWRNLFENPTFLQFVHRCLAIATLAIVLAGWGSWRFRVADSRQRRALDLLLGAALLQVSLGIATLLLYVPVSLGTLHQGGAVLLLSAVLLLAHECGRRPTLG